MLFLDEIGETWPSRELQAKLLRFLCRTCAVERVGDEGIAADVRGAVCDHR